MEYFEIVLRAVAAPLDWLAQIWTADAFLFDALLGLFFVNFMYRFFMRPLFSDAGSDKVTKRKNH